MAALGKLIMGVFPRWTKRKAKINMGYSKNKKRALSGVAQWVEHGL